MVRNFYKDLFRDYPSELARAEKLSERIYEFTEFLVDVLGIEDLGFRTNVDADLPPLLSPVTRTSHKRAAAIAPNKSRRSGNHTDGARRGLLRVRGAFSVKMSDVSTAMLNEKLDNVVATGASTLIAGDTGCIMHMQGGLRRRGSDVQVVHIAELLDANSELNRGARS